MSTILRTIGIDVSRDWLDAFAAPEGEAARFSNDGAGFQKLIVWVGSEVDRIAYEPSGPFHRDLEDALLGAGLPIYAINPFHARSFARSLGRRAKTDAVDASVLATMAAAIEDLRPTEARSEGQRDLAELQQVRDALRRDRTATLNRSKHLRTAVGKRLSRQRLRQIDRQLKVVDAEIRRRLGEEKALERRAEILTSIPGISDVTAAGLIVLMPELGALTGARAASLAGLAPITRESGKWKGRSFIQGGRHRVRRLLFMPALAAVRHNPDLKRKYEALRAAGKPPKVALTAVMRKLLILANALVRQDRTWTESPPRGCSRPAFPPLPASATVHR
ncbi:MAG: IS110 family transposase [Gemmatimonadetes bacterium]|nr:IS110 family transposase [Gemmatimonadota bacterium]